MVYEIGSSSKKLKLEQNSEGQSVASSSKSAYYRHISNWGISRDDKTDVHSNNQYDQKGVEQSWGVFKDLPVEIQDIVSKKFLAKGLVKVLCEDFIDKSTSSYADHYHKIIDILPEIDGKLATKELVKRLDRGRRPPETRLRMVFAIGMSGDQSIIPELTKKLSMKRIHIEVRAAILGTIGMLGGRSELAKVLSSKKVGQMPEKVREWAERLMENPSAGQELAEELTQELAKNIPYGQPDARRCEEIISVTGKLGDMSVARALAEKIPQWYSQNYSYRSISRICEGIGEIGRRLVNPVEVKELADTLVEMVSQDNIDFIMKSKIIKVIGELTKRLARFVGQKATTSEDQGLVKREDVKRFSKRLIRILFDRVHRVRQYGLDIPVADAVFGIEQCLAEPDPFERFSNRKEVNRKVYDEIAKELLEYRRELGSPLAVKDFSNNLVNMVSMLSIKKDMRCAIAYSIAYIREIEDTSVSSQKPETGPLMHPGQKRYDGGPSATSPQNSEIMHTSVLRRLKGQLYNKCVEEDLEAIRKKDTCKKIAYTIENLENEPFISELFKVLSPSLFNKDAGEKKEKALEILRLSTEITTTEEFAEKLTNRQIKEPVRKAMARLLGIVGKPPIVPKLVEIFSNREIGSEVRGSIIDATEKITQKYGKNVPEKLYNIFDDENSDKCHRMSAANIAWQISLRSEEKEDVKKIYQELAEKIFRRFIRN